MCSHSPAKRPLTNEAHVIMIWLYRRVYGTEVGPPLVCLLILGRKKKIWCNEFNKSSRGPDQLLTMQSAGIDYLSSAPSPSASVSDIPQWMSGNKMDFSPAVNRISYLSAYPTKLFTLYTTTLCVI